MLISLALWGRLIIERHGHDMEFGAWMAKSLSIPMKGSSEIRNEILCVTMYYLVHFRCALNLLPICISISFRTEAQQPGHIMILAVQVDECKADHGGQDSGKMLVCEKVYCIQSRQGSVFDIAVGW